jgi:hypothetical protein
MLSACKQHVPHTISIIIIKKLSLERDDGDATVTERSTKKKKKKRM